MNLVNLPQELKKAVEKESLDFIVYRTKGFRGTYKGLFLFFGLFWTLIGISLFLLFFLKLLPLEGSGNTNYINFLKTPSLILVIGIIILSIVIYKYHQSREYFVGTSTRLFQYQNGAVISTHWSRFETNILVEKKENYGCLTLIPYGSWNKSENKRIQQYLIKMTNIPNVYQVEKCCRKRILENT